MLFRECPFLIGFLSEIKDDEEVRIMERISSQYTEGIDSKQFYKEFGTNILRIHQDTGIDRAVLCRMPANRTNKKSTEKIVAYLEKLNIEEYNHQIDVCRNEIKKSINNVESAWDEYERKERELDKFRQKYEIERILKKREKKAGCEILEELLE